MVRCSLTLNGVSLCFFFIKLLVIDYFHFFGNSDLYSFVGIIWSPIFTVGMIFYVSKEGLVIKYLKFLLRVYNNNFQKSWKNLWNSSVKYVVFGKILNAPYDSKMYLFCTLCEFVILINYGFGHRMSR
jgi:hypothetical protein